LLTNTVPAVAEREQARPEMPSIHFHLESAGTFSLSIRQTAGRPIAL
jgi:hypothetical protein